ncbi:serine hydrolase [Actinoplanes awajinensis]|uniref:Beta-lactamase-related domain-containing protein n=1 Tax=Actinoplanes awajinensis subsp. mycoplanecinus TaxID=135947 RepID=A0A101JF74_9ACTN|nr:serine hydrolase [Actinoplanes awajinensis]KUL25700.1 hypothetical protein ADL15_40155 [Actinoplanes awajinensis subsp. mycoplanecinus]
MHAAIALVLGLVTTIGVAGRAQGAAPQLPELDPALLGRAVAGLPNPVVTGVQLTISGSAGRWSGRAGVADVTTGAPESGIVSSTADLTRFLSALLGGRLLPRAQLAPMLTLPDVPYPGGGTCRLGPHPGRACFSAGLQATTFPDGVTVWGRSGAVPGYTTGVFATADLARVMASSLNPTGNRDGSEARYVQNIAAAGFDPSLFAD